MTETYGNKESSNTPSNGGGLDYELHLLDIQKSEEESFVINQFKGYRSELGSNITENGTEELDISENIPQHNTNQLNNDYKENDNLLMSKPTGTPRPRPDRGASDHLAHPWNLLTPNYRSEGYHGKDEELKELQDLDTFNNNLEAGSSKIKVISSAESNEEKKKAIVEVYGKETAEFITIMGEKRNYSIEQSAAINNVYAILLNNKNVPEEIRENGLSGRFEKDYDQLKDGTIRDLDTSEKAASQWDILCITKIFYDQIKKGNYNIGDIKLDETQLSNIDNPLLVKKIKENNGILSLDSFNENIKSEVIQYLGEKCVDDLLDILVREKPVRVSEINLQKIAANDQKLKSILSSEFIKRYLGINDEKIIYASFLYCLKGLGNEVPKELVNENILLRLSHNVYKSNKRSNELYNRIKQWKIERNKRIKGADTHVVIEDESTAGYTDLQAASGADIAKNAGLGEDLKKYDVNKNLEVSDEHMKHIQQEAFPTAWHNFIENNSDISGYIDDLDMKLIYNFDNNSINESERKKLSERLKRDFGNDIDLDEIHDRLSGFLTEMDNVKGQLIEDHISESGAVYEDAKLDAIGGVIDSIKSIFDKMGEEMKFGQLCDGFKYDEREPVKIEGNKLIIKGLLNGTKTKVCYDLKNGELYMNSFIQESVNPAMITVGDRWNDGEDYPEADVEIGRISSFEDVLSDIDISEECDVENEGDMHLEDAPHPDNMNRPMDVPGSRNNINQEVLDAKRTTLTKGGEPRNGSKRPWHNMISNAGEKAQKIREYSKSGRLQRPNRRPIPEGPVPFEPQVSMEETIRINAKINNAIDLIGEEVRKHTEKQSQKNDIIIKFMKTFNIVSDQGTIKSMQFHEGSNIYNLLHIIENSDSNQLTKFSSFMNDISKYSGLTRGNNNSPEIQNNRMFKEIKESNQDDKNSARGCLKKSLMNFKNESVNMGNQNVLNFESSNKLGMAQLIIDNIITNPKDVVNSKFETIKIDSFLRSLNTGYGINEYAGGNPDDILNQLDNV